MSFQKKIIKDFLCNRNLGSVLKHIPIFNAGVEGNESGGTQVTFPNPDDVRILCSMWR